MVRAQASCWLADAVWVNIRVQAQLAFLSSNTHI